jgi:hypothetical protein
VEFELDRGLPDVIDIHIGDTHLRQPVDFWKEPFCFHSCWQPGHLKTNCPDLMERNVDPTQLEVTEDPVGTSGSEVFDKISFLGKMQLFFPSFFNKLSSDEIDYLKINERWVLEIFGDFWDLLMKKFEEPGVWSGLGTKGVGPVNSPGCSPGDTQPIPSPGGNSVDDVPTKLEGLRKPFSNDIVQPCSEDVGLPSPSVDSVVPSEPIGVRCAISECPVYPTGGESCTNDSFFNSPLNLQTKTIKTLSPTLLSISNNSHKILTAPDHSNVTIRKKNLVPVFLKKKPGATAGGLAHFGEFPSGNLEPDNSFQTIRPASLNPLSDRSSRPTLRASQPSSVVSL